MTFDPLYKSDAAVGERDRAGVPEVVFYQVKHRFVDNERSIPEESADIIYYTLAIGHHTGIIDASEERLRCPLAVYEAMCESLPEGEARYKLEAVLRGGEVYIDKFKAPELRDVIAEQVAEADGGSVVVADDLETITREAVELDAEPVYTDDPTTWMNVFLSMLTLMEINPAAAITGGRRGL